MRGCYYCRNLPIPRIGLGGYQRKGDMYRVAYHGGSPRINPFVAPKLSAEAQENLYQDGSLHRVLPAVNKINREISKAYYTMGAYIQRELRYDFPLYDKRHLCRCGRGTHALYLWMDGDRVIGAVSFSMCRYTNLEPMWELQFAWIMPEHRHTGLLSNAWSTLKRNHGSFIVQQPYSDEMRSFLDKQEHGSIRTTDDKLDVNTY